MPTIVTDLASYTNAKTLLLLGTRTAITYLLALKNVLVFLLIVGHEKTQLNFSDRFPAAQEGSVKKNMYGRVALICGQVEKLEL